MVFSYEFLTKNNDSVNLERPHGREDAKYHCHVHAYDILDSLFEQLSPEVNLVSHYRIKQGFRREVTLVKIMDRNLQTTSTLSKHQLNKHVSCYKMKIASPGNLRCSHEEIFYNNQERTLLRKM